MIYRAITIVYSSTKPEFMFLWMHFGLEGLSRCCSPVRRTRFPAAVCFCFSSIIAGMLTASWALQSSTSISFKVLLSSWISLSLRHISSLNTTPPSSTSFVISVTAAFANISMMADTCEPKEEGKDILQRDDTQQEKANVKLY